MLFDGVSGRTLRVRCQSLLWERFWGGGEWALPLAAEAAAGVPRGKCRGSGLRVVLGCNRKRPRRLWLKARNHRAAVPVRPASARKSQVVSGTLTARTGIGEAKGTCHEDLSHLDEDHRRDAVVWRCCIGRLGAGSSNRPSRARYCAAGALVSGRPRAAVAARVGPECLPLTTIRGGRTRNISIRMLLMGCRLS